MAWSASALASLLTFAWHHVQPVEPAATAPAPTGLPQPVVQPQAPAPTPHASDADRFLGGLLNGGGGSLESAPPNDRRRPDAQRRRAERLR